MKLRTFTRYSARVLAVMSILLVMIVLIGTASRYTGEAIFGTDEIAILLALWIYFLGMAVATGSDSHIEGGILSALNLTEAARIRLSIGKSIVGLAVLLVFGFYSVTYFVDLWESGRTSTYYRLPSTLWAGALVFGLLFSTIAIAAQLVQQIRIASAQRRVR